MGINSGFKGLILLCKCISQLTWVSTTSGKCICKHIIGYMWTDFLIPKTLYKPPIIQLSPFPELSCRGPKAQLAYRISTYNNYKLETRLKLKELHEEKNVKIHNKNQDFPSSNNINITLWKTWRKSLCSTAHKTRNSKAPKTQRANLWLRTLCYTIIPGRQI